MFTDGGGKDVGISNRRGARCTSPLSRARGVRKVSATCNSDGLAEADGSLMFSEVLRPAPGEGISARLIVPPLSLARGLARAGATRQRVGLTSSD